VRLSKPIFGLISIGIVLVSLLTSCEAVSNQVNKIKPKPVALNSFTGAPGVNGPVLAVKVDDTKAAHPQIGLEYADVIYIEQVEAGLTRLLAIFSSNIPNDIGPIRSVRIGDIELLGQYGRVGLAYSGAQSKMRPVIAAANIADLGAEHNSPTVYYRDPNRSAPTDMVLNTAPLMAKAKNLVIAKPMGWTFGKAPEAGAAITGVKVSWPSANYGALWSGTEARWLLSYNGSPDIAASGSQLGSPTFVIQIVKISPSIYGDKFGGITPMSETVGSGHGYILRDGKVFPANWNRSNAEAGTNWLQSDGTELPFAPGQIWIALTDQEPEFSYLTTKTPSATPTTTK
jgi:hypothetical protein